LSSPAPGKSLEPWVWAGSRQRYSVGGSPHSFSVIAERSVAVKVVGAVGGVVSAAQECWAGCAGGALKLNAVGGGAYAIRIGKRKREDGVVEGDAVGRDICRNSSRLTPVFSCRDHIAGHNDGCRRGSHARFIGDA